MADGWDKTGACVPALDALGFGGGSVGTVTLEAQAGNARPRLFRPSPGTGLNRMGFNSPGAAGVAVLLEKAGKLFGMPTGSPEFPVPVGINVGPNKNKVHETPEEIARLHAAVITQLYPYAQFFTLGLSSPNTAGLRDVQQDEAKLTAIIEASFQAMQQAGGRKPLFLKIDPDTLVSWRAKDPEKWQALDRLIDKALAMRCAGIIAVNSTTSKSAKEAYSGRWAGEPGGLTGDNPEYRGKALQIVRHIRQRAGGDLCIGGVGGVHDLPSFLDMINAGADFVQLLTALRPSRGKVAAAIGRDLLRHMDTLGFANFAELRAFYHANPKPLVQ